MTQEQVILAVLTTLAFLCSHWPQYVALLLFTVALWWRILGLERYFSKQSKYAVPIFIASSCYVIMTFEIALQQKQWFDRIWCFLEEFRVIMGAYHTKTVNTWHMHDQISICLAYLIYGRCVWVLLFTFCWRYHWPNIQADNVRMEWMQFRFSSILKN